MADSPLQSLVKGNNLRDVSEVRELTDEAEVNTLLKKGYELIEVRTHKLTREELESVSREYEILGGLLYSASRPEAHVVKKEEIVTHYILGKFDRQS